MRKFLFALLLFPSFVFSAIFSTSSICDLLKHADKDTLFVFDLNETLMQTKKYVGSESWARSELEKEITKTGKTKDGVYEYFIPKWTRILLNAHHIPVERCTVEVFHQLQKKGYSPLGLTARNVDMAFQTYEQLRLLGMDFAKTALYPYDKEILGGYAAKYISGIVFAGIYNDKGETLFSFFDEIGHQPIHIVYIDDKIKNVLSVERACEKRDVAYTGIEYTYVEDRQTLR